MAAGAVVHRLRMALVALSARVLAVLGDMRVAGAGQVGGQGHEVVAGHDGTVSVGVAAGVQAELIVFSATSSNELADVAGLEDGFALLVLASDLIAAANPVHALGDLLGNDRLMAARQVVPASVLCR